MAPCTELTGQQHGIFWLLCSRRNRRSGISKYDTDALTQILGLPQSVVRNEIDGLVDLDLLEITEAGLRPISICQCNRNQDRPLHSQRGIAEGRGDPRPNDRLGAPSLPGDRGRSGSRSLAAAVKSSKPRVTDLLYDGEAAVQKPYRPPGKWTYYELAQFFGREAAWKLKAAPPNYKALSRLLKDLNVSGISKIEIHRMILLFVSDPKNKGLAQPAWKVFYSRRDALLVQARRRLRTLERIRSYESDERIEPEVALARRETAYSQEEWALVQGRA